jgi:hypothetical protein
MAIEMNGLEVIDLQPTSFVAKLLGHRPKENAFLEIHNVVASLPIYHLAEDAVAACLSRYDTTHEEGKPRLLNIYSQVLDHFIKDLSISDDEVLQLRHLATIFKLTSDEVSQIHAAIVYPHYERAVQGALEDNELSKEEDALLDILCLKLMIPEEAANEIYKKHAVPIYNRAVNKALADRMLSPEEEAELARVAKSLKLSIQPDERSESILKRARRLWRIAQGELPILRVPINLQFNERCSASVEALHYEPGTISRGVSYSGFSTSYSAFGIRFLSGIINTQRLSSEALLHRGFGTLYFTNRRILFNGNSKTTQIYLGKIIGITFYSDGLRIEKETGKDQIFTFSGDMDMLRLIVDNLMTSYRESAPPKSARTGSTSHSSSRKKSSKPAVVEQEGFKSPYEVLEISVNAPIEEIKIAYRRMATLYHPDKVAHLAPEFREMAEKRMKEINKAYEALKTKK